ncbi:hypothetical protein M3641_26210 [Bacillus cereus]|uniref:hypothetical protein n=1 Tax=Bacillus cereus TaxID=1396 RepID=UPI0020413FBD|nr:hypothetical protein [Bacillus cereus]MCM3330158.1 hypothetical protein [Bacillus cereus]
MKNEIIKAKGYLERKGVLFEGQREFPNIEVLQSSNIHHNLNYLYKLLDDAGYSEEEYNIKDLRYARPMVNNKGAMTVIYCSKRYIMSDVENLAERYYNGKNIPDKFIDDEL